MNDIARQIWDMKYRLNRRRHACGRRRGGKLGARRAGAAGAEAPRCAATMPWNSQAPWRATASAGRAILAAPAPAQRHAVQLLRDGRHRRFMDGIFSHLREAALTAAARRRHRL